MDIKRLVFLIPVVLLAYLLMIQWNQDYGDSVTDSTSSQTDQRVSAGDSDVSNNDTLSVPSTATSDDPAPAEQITDNGNTTQRDVIAVTTDVLDVRIDPVGGDIIYAALPQHKRRLESDQPFVLLSDNQARSYVARSGVQLDDSAKRIDFEYSSTDYDLGENNDDIQVDLKAVLDGIEVTKRLTFERGSYAVDVAYYLNNQTEETVSARFIGQLARDDSQDPTSGAALGMQSFLGAAYSTPETNYEKVSFKDIEQGKFENKEAEGGWVAIIQHYFASAWAPKQDQENLYYATTDSSGRNVAAFAGPLKQLEAGQDASLSATLYIGPKVQDYMEAVAPNLQLTVDYGWLWFLASPLFWLLDTIHSVVGNWGWSIIFLTIAVKLVLWPLSAKAYRSMGRMRKLGPEMQRLKEKFGDDRQKMSQEMMKFYQKEKINPLGGCLPILVQMPVFIALYWMLLESVELRHAPFMLWINDLSVKDPYFVLPILMGASMYVQQLLNPAPPDPMQAKIMKMLPIVFTFFFLWFPAGLVIYWVINNIVSVSQQYYITRKIENDPTIGGKGQTAK